jgi:ABC-type transport system involved in multi-copper enzyme maturation permease subunit
MTTNLPQADSAQPQPFSAPDKTKPGIRQVFSNPVTVKELRGRMRRGRVYVIITVYLVLMSVLVGLAYMGFSSSANSVGNSGMVQSVGKVVFGIVVGVEMMMVCFIAPALTAGAISSERERQTFDLLRTTLLPARSIVTGKLVSALFFLLLLLLVGLPLQSLASLFGGVAIEEVLVSFLLLAVSALAFSAIGLLVSSLVHSTLGSTVISYVASIIVVFGEPTLIGIALSFLSMLTSLMYSTSLSAFQTQMIEILLFSVGYILVVINPLATIIASEVMLIEKQALFFTTLPLTNGGNFPILAPWIAYILIYGCLSLVLISLSVRFVRRAEK